MAMIPIIAGRKNLEAANALMGATGQLTLFIGPAMAGYLVELAGIGLAFLVDGLTFIASLVTLAYMKTTGLRNLNSQPEPVINQVKPLNPVSNNQTNVWEDIKEGLKYTLGNPLLRSIMLLSAAINFSLVGPIVIGLPALVKFRFESEADLFGIWLSCWGLAALVSSILGGSFPIRRKRGLLLVGVSLIFGICFGLIGFAHNEIAIGLILAIVGLANGYLNVVNASWIQGMIEQKLLGRVMSLLILSSLGLTPISHALTGKLIDHSITLTFIIAGSLVITAALVSLFTSNLRHAD